MCLDSLSWPKNIHKLREFLLVTQKPSDNYSEFRSERSKMTAALLTPIPTSSESDGDQSAAKIGATKVFMVKLDFSLSVLYIRMTPLCSTMSSL